MSIEVIKAFRQKPIIIYPVYLDITGDYAAAAALGQVLYWHEVMDGKFYKTDSDFEQELRLTPKQFRRVKTELKSLSFLKITLEQVPAKTFYDVDYKALTDLIQSIIGGNKSPFEQTRPTQKGQTRPAQKGQTVPAQKGQTVPAQKGQTITENTTEITTENNNNSRAAAQSSKTAKSVNEIFLLSQVGFTEKQKATAIKKLDSLTADQRDLAIQIFNKTISLGGLKKPPMALFNQLVNLGLQGELEPMKAAQSIQTPEQTQKAVLESKKRLESSDSMRMEVLKSFVSRKKAQLLEEFNRKGIVFIPSVTGGFIEPDLRAAGLFD